MSRTTCKSFKAELEFSVPSLQSIIVVVRQALALQI